MPATNVNWPVPLTRFPTLWPGQMGVPGTDNDRGERMHCTGEVFYVDPNFPGASDQRDGTSPTDPLLTVDAAIGKCQAYRGDVVVVMFNSYWTYGNTAVGYATPIQETATLDVPGVRLVGVASGCLGVPWVGTANNDTLITVTAIDCTIEGFNFWDPTYTGVTAIECAWNGPPYGENLTVKHCYFYDLGVGVSLDYSWNCVIEDCRFDSISTTAIDNPGVYGDPDYLVVRNCQFHGNTVDIGLDDTDECLIEGNRFFDVTAAISMAGGNNNQIKDNVIQGAGAGVNNMINLTGGGSNMVGGNYLSCTIAQYDTTCSDATSGSWGGNECENGPTTAAPT